VLVGGQGALKVPLRRQEQTEQIGRAGIAIRRDLLKQATGAVGVALALGVEGFVQFRHVGHSTPRDRPEPRYAGRWHTASMLLPSGSRTKAP
jgi:hypothetical protein